MFLALISIVFCSLQNIKVSLIKFQPQVQDFEKILRQRPIFLKNARRCKHVDMKQRSHSSLNSDAGIAVYIFCFVTLLFERLRYSQMLVQKFASKSYLDFIGPVFVNYKITGLYVALDALL